MLKTPDMKRIEAYHERCVQLEAKMPDFDFDIFEYIDNKLEVTRQWTFVEASDREFSAVHKKDQMLTMIASIEPHEDLRVWLHLSIAHLRRIPTYDELAAMKDAFARDRRCIMVMVPKTEHVNIHPHCLHLYTCIRGEDHLPDFTQGTGSI